MKRLASCFWSESTNNKLSNWPPRDADISWRRALSIFLLWMSTTAFVVFSSSTVVSCSDNFFFYWNKMASDLLHATSFFTDRMKSKMTFAAVTSSSELMQWKSVFPKAAQSWSLCGPIDTLMRNTAGWNKTEMSFNRSSDLRLTRCCVSRCSCWSASYLNMILWRGQ